MKNNWFLLLLFYSLFVQNDTKAQVFYFGADLSYVNEMEDCGVIYKEQDVAADPYLIFARNGCNLVRIRLWHTPSWYDSLNEGKRYSDRKDVLRSLLRAKENGMQVLLDFHLSDNWADPSSQRIPVAWLPVYNDLEALSDSIYNHIYETLSFLYDNNALPEMIQVGNETNKGILLSPEDNQGWMLDWSRNAKLFNAGIKAVRDLEAEISEEIKVVLHVAGPDNAEWLIDGFVSNGVVDFDIIAMSYYWAWHKPTDIEDAGNVIEDLKLFYPDKEVLIAETGYIWTNQWNDNASNIITETHPNYSPASPQNQRDWLIALTKKVKEKQGLGVVYWEPAWVSSPCFTQWGQGSHQEHATFFDFQNNVIKPGGIDWMSYDYGLVNNTLEVKKELVRILTNGFSGDITIILSGQSNPHQYMISDTSGVIVEQGKLMDLKTQIKVDNIPEGGYIISVVDGTGNVTSRPFFLSK